MLARAFYRPARPRWPVLAPGDVSGLQAYFAADAGLWADDARTTPAAADGDALAAWDDQSGAGVLTSLAQTSVALRPLLKLNVHAGKPAILFNGTTQYLLGNALAAAFSGTDQPYTVIGTFRKVSNSSSACMVGCGRSSTATPYLYVGTTTNGYKGEKHDDAAAVASVSVAQPAVGGPGTTLAQTMAWVSDGVSCQLGRNRLVFNAAAQAQDVGATTLDRFAVGALVRTSAALYWPGYLFGLAVYNRALTQAEWCGVSEYFKRKWQSY